MEKILEYTRLTFEERFMDKSSRFKCTKEFAKQGFGSCVCIPGIAINFCLILAEHCFTDMKITEEIHWDDQYKLYLPICTYNEERIAPNKTIENSIKCKLADEICKDNPNEFAYIKIRDVNSLNALYSSKGPYFKELLIVDKTEKFSNSMDFLSLFVGVANSSRMSRSLESYADSLFRLLQNIK